MTSRILRIYRRWNARNWRCRCGKRVFDQDALTPHPLAPSRPGCGWHESVQRRVLDGRIKTAEEAR